MSGPLPKPKARRQNRSRKDAGVVELVATQRTPEVPGQWLPVTVDAWQAFWLSPAAELVAAHHRPVLDRLFDWRDRQRRELDNAARFRTAADAEPFIEGSTGQPKINPMFDLADKCDARALSIEGQLQKLEAQFPLSPAATLKLGVVFQQRQNLEALNAAAAGIPKGPTRPDPRAIEA
jgi:hypothetical protein